MGANIFSDHHFPPFSGSPSLLQPTVFAVHHPKVEHKNRSCTMSCASWSDFLPPSSSSSFDQAWINPEKFYFWRAQVQCSDRGCLERIHVAHFVLGYFSSNGGSLFVFFLFSTNIGVLAFFAEAKMKFPDCGFFHHHLMWCKIFCLHRFHIFFFAPIISLIRKYSPPPKYQIPQPKARETSEG